MVEYYKTALRNYDCENARTFKCLSVSNLISVEILPSLSRVAFNFVIILIIHIYLFFNFLGPQ